MRIYLSSVVTVVLAALSAKLPWSKLSRLQWRNVHSLYDVGLYGSVPSKSYYSSQIESPRVEFLSRTPLCSKDAYFLTPGANGAAILDHNGELLWQQTDFGDRIFDIKPQTYQERPYLTFWAGKRDQGTLIGSWYMVRHLDTVYHVTTDCCLQMNETYDIEHTIHPVGYEFSDMHELTITESDTAILAIYAPIPANLTSIGGAEHGYILDNIVQEIDIATGTLLFEWHASQYVPIHTTYKTLARCSNDTAAMFRGCGYTPEAAFDYFHINSVQKDRLDNYLISARCTSSLVYIDGRTGSILWTMGGAMNQFTFEGGDGSSFFSWQHDAQFHANGSVTVFDNNAHPRLDTGARSRGLRLNVDQGRRNVSLAQVFEHPGQRASYSQGNMQTFGDNGHVQIGWGSTAAMTEYSSTGDVLSDVVFGPGLLLAFQASGSYRVYRGTWRGFPQTRPSVHVQGSFVYVSWNGATEVQSWRLDAVRGNSTEFVAQKRKTGFETCMFLESDGFNKWRVVGIDAHGQALGGSTPFTIGRSTL